MSTHLVRAEDLSVSFGPAQVLHNATFQIDPGDKIALVGPNGAGKSTILNLVAGRLIPDSGVLDVRPGLRVGYMTQNLEFPGDRTVADLLREAPPHLRRIQHEMEAIEARMATAEFYAEPGHADVLARYAELQRESAKASAQVTYAGVPPVAHELGFSDEDLARPARELSGGQKTRLLLARALLGRGNVDLLLLDEPTNHLDLDTVEWVEGLLAAYEGALVVVSHDRYLLDAVADYVVEIDRLRTIGYVGNYSDHRSQKDAMHAAIEARRRREHAEVQRQWQIIQEIKKRNRFDAQATSKARRLEHARREHVVYKPPRKPLNIRFPAVEKISEDVAAMRGVSKRFGPRVVLRDVELEIRKGDKIGVVGRNGAGKTTLVRLLLGQLKPDAGSVELAPGAAVGYYDQEHQHLDPERTLVEEILTMRPLMPEVELRGLLGRFGFGGDEVFGKIGNLSGGERSRVALAKFIVGENNCLILDEPTNHLDIESQEAIADAVANYPGTCLVVSHDRAFLDSVTNRTAWLRDGTLKTAPGGFSDAQRWLTGRRSGS